MSSIRKETFRGMRSRAVALAVGGVLAVVGSAGVRGAEASRPRPTPDEVRAVVARLFDGMREADSLKVRSVFAEGARFASRVAQDGSELIQYSAVDGFVQAVGGSERRWDERVFDVELHVDDYMATVWAPYTFYLDGRILHCGVNLMDFLRVGGEWKITQLTDTRRTDGCRDVPPSRR